MGKRVQLNLYVPEEVKDTLQRMAAERMLENPKKTVYATGIALQIIYEYLEREKTPNNDHNYFMEGGID